MTGRCRIARWWIAALAFFVAWPALAKRDAKGREIEVWQGEPLFVLSSPWSGARLAGGKSLVLSWNGTHGLGDESWVEEWEAFLSLDGGASYSIRLTPHLDLSRRSFAVRLPDISTRSARLMFRMGNERRELELELPWLFEISSALSPPAESRGWAVGPGEAARSGEAGVVSWVEGPRDGSRTRERRAGRTEAGVRSVAAGAGASLVAAAPSSRAPSLALHEPVHHPESRSPSVAPSAGVEIASLGIPPLRQTCRQNE